jgi:glycosyltransferase involved in cell wall biosynthesis
MDIGKPFFSVVIPTLNEEKCLPRLLEDLTEQEMKDFEVLVVDGKSEDRTKEKAGEFADKLDLKFLETKIRGVANQRNLGAGKAGGEYLVFLDADVRIPANYLAAVEKRLKVSPVEVLTTWVIPDTKKRGDKVITDLLNYILEMSKYLSPACLGSQMVVRRAAFEAVKGFDTEVPYGEDTVLVREIVENGGAYVLLKQPKAVWSFRRFEREGRAQAVLEYLILNLHLMLGDPKKPPLTYEMGGKAEGKSKIKVWQVRKIQGQIKEMKEQYQAKIQAHPELGPLAEDLKRGWERVKKELE